MYEPGLQGITFYRKYDIDQLHTCTVEHFNTDGKYVDMFDFPLDFLDVHYNVWLQYAGIFLQ